MGINADKKPDMQRGTDLETHGSKWEVFSKSLLLLLREWGMPLKKWKE